MTTDFRALCAELVACAPNARRMDGISTWEALLTRARAALAEPEPEGPTDQELLRLYGVSTPCYNVKEYKRELDFARAVLARWGRPAPQPANGEVAEIADHIRAELKGFHPRHRVLGEMTVARLTRAASLLERLSLPEPVPVSEWQTIDTAPKDGTEILASDYDAVEILSWLEGRFELGIPGEWISRDGETFYPAWWQPLPDHPALPLPGEVES